MDAFIDTMLQEPSSKKKFTYELAPGLKIEIHTFPQGVASIYTDFSVPPPVSIPLEERSAMLVYLFDSLGKLADELIKRKITVHCAAIMGPGMLLGFNTPQEKQSAINLYTTLSKYGGTLVALIPIHEEGTVDETLAKVFFGTQLALDVGALKDLTLEEKQRVMLEGMFQLVDGVNPVERFRKFKSLPMIMIGFPNGQRPSQVMESFDSLVQEDFTQPEDPEGNES